MTKESQSINGKLPSPLSGFDFVRGWIDGLEFVRDALPDLETQLATRLDSFKHQPWQPWSLEDISELRGFNSSAGNEAGAILADSLSQPDTLVVVTGQQPNLLASPLYIIHKALSAIAWARKLQLKLKRPVVPVFWVASDDDDFDELKHSWFVTASGELTDVGRHLSGSLAGRGKPAYLWNFDDAEVEKVALALKNLAGTQENASEVGNWLTENVARYPNFESCFCYLLAQLLGPSLPMLFVVPRLNSLRRLQVPILINDLDVHSRVNAQISETSAVFETAGYAVPLHRDEGAINFFWIKDGVRHRLQERDGQVVATAPTASIAPIVFPKAHLVAMLKESPEQFCPNVVTRPLVQDRALPSVAYVGGPGETAYLALLKGVYSAHGQERAAILPRAFVTLIPSGKPASQEPVNALDILSAHKDGDKLTGLLAELESSVSRGMEGIRKGCADNAAALKAVLKTERHMEHGIHQLKRRLARQLSSEKWHSAMRNMALIRPGGVPQERRLGPWNFVPPGKPSALAEYLVTQLDYTQSRPAITKFPPWMDPS